MQSDVCSAGEERGYWTTPAMRPFAMWSASLNLDTLGLGAPDSCLLYVQRNVGRTERMECFAEKSCWLALSFSCRLEADSAS
jgi:hypothetical protein